jgi:hypothetical protein
VEELLAAFGQVGQDDRMYIMYVDESGDTGLVNSPTKYFSLSSITVHESRWRDFINALIAFRKTMRAVYGLPVRAEIHASEFINHRPFDLEKHVRLAILRNALDELAKIDYISVTSVVVRKAGKAADYDVFTNAWTTLFQRFENTLTWANFPGGHRNDYGMTITDATAGRKLVRLVRKMAVVNYVPHDPRFGGGARNLPITKIIEDPHGKDSADTLPIQMCDVAGYFLNQRYVPNSYIQRQNARHYFDRLRPILNRRASRWHPLGIVEL